MELEFITSNADGCYKGQFLKHMGDLQNINIKENDTFMDVVNCLKEKNQKEEKIKAIDEWVDLNIDAKDMMAQDVFGILCGYAVFNFIEV